MKKRIAVTAAALALALACRTNHADPAVASTASTEQSPTPATSTTTTPPAPAPAPQDELASAARVTLEELQSRLSKGTAVIVDVRPAESYRESHIVGAINIPLTELEARLDSLPKDKFIVTYCT